MRNKSLVSGLLATLILGVSHHAVAQTTESDATKIKRLETTVEELTLQLAETIQERNRLRSALAQALEAKSQGRQVVTGCDLSAAHDFIAYSDFSEGYAAGIWLSTDDNAKRCTKSQLLEIDRTYQIKQQHKAYKILRHEISRR